MDKVYAQIKDGIVINTMVLNDDSDEQKAIHAVGFDKLIYINDIVPRPGPAWIDNGDGTFSAPAEIVGDNS